MSRVIKNCLITQSDATVLKEYCVDKSNPLYMQYRGFNTCINLEATTVYSPYYGTVSNVSGNHRFGYEVVISINPNQAIKFSHLKNTILEWNQTVDVGQKVGEANKYVSFEYITTYVKNQYDTKVGGVKMYKDDPAKVIDPNNSVMKTSAPKFSDSGLQEVVSDLDGGIDESSQYILSNNKGD